MFEEFVAKLASNIIKMEKRVV